MIIFNGVELAQKREARLKEKVNKYLAAGAKPVIAAILFIEDEGSQLYTRLKSQAAEKLGIEYRVFEFSLKDNLEKIQTKIEELGKSSEITGIIIQKPWRKTWVRAQNENFLKVAANQPDPRRFERDQYGSWWTKLTSYIDENKDVDGLHPITIQQISRESWKDMGKVLPATCQAVLNILDDAFEQISRELKLDKTQQIFNGKYIIIGKSDLVGIPLFYELRRQGRNVEIIASKELNERVKSGQKLLDASIVISATGINKLVTGDMVSDNVVIIDVGEPHGDVDFESVKDKAVFITPVPGGVGPMTVISLLENCSKLCEARQLNSQE